MKIMIKAIVLVGAMLSAFTVYAVDFGVELKWNTQDQDKVLKAMPEQKEAFGQLIKKGSIKDMYIYESEIDGKPTRLIRFVISGDSEKQVRNTLEKLPLYKQNLVKIVDVLPLGSKWLDKTPLVYNYGITMTWKEGIDPAEIDRVLGIDLQRVVSLNQAGFLTSAYLNTQEVSKGVTRPVYHVAFIAQDEAHVKELSKQFEAIRMGYADIQVQPLGNKVNLDNLVGSQ
ncbi:conserved hypothetical protein [Vibrio nigripulchritudo SO65]|uniref:hypothetical protein n=1 Tax=Vibrio nigripulchritudo TaxID=28173 RepID=UPI0003B1FA85|nr:hypothetical protein [Vibrio nigripulchritudo]CCN36345.1 conserved hypothetical protein [Vibrio nigripulchritudo AM115]CCN40636.1 conserved hypothetical protein [Vibrio nigripulchritudo FTn2]CCN64557.1 conserved hypothetical protein [Vibrio nigripulchritudo POn4]CCN77336.1 conserved hypothetical protein [Vibrio nigripulchritudo SO65]